MRRSPSTAGPREDGELVALAYQSRAVTPLSEDSLRQLEAAADRANRREGITGVMVYDDGQFFQWLEGPAGGLSRLWHAISRDARHTDLHVSAFGARSGRTFGEFGMKLLRRGDPLWSSRALLAIELPALVEQLVVPLLAERRRTKAEGLVTPERQLAEFASRLLEIDETAAWALARQLAADAGPLELTRRSVLDPAARSLGDLWYRDECSGLELDLALVRLGAIAHHLAGTRFEPALANRAVLVVPSPGEPHLLAAAVDAELLCHAGWATRAEFPESDEALHALVANEWFDVLDLSLSTALRREGSLGKLEATIASARLASCNPALVVVVGGRVFSERPNVAPAIGADVDAARVTALARAVEAVLRRPRSTNRQAPAPGLVEPRRAARRS